MCKFNNWIGLMQCKTLTPTEKVTIGNILVFNNAKDMGYWNNTPLTLLAENVNISTRGLSKVVKKLEDKGIITKKQKTYRNANDYVPNIEAINNLIETLNKEQSSNKGNSSNKEQSSNKNKEQSSDKGNGLNKEQSSDRSKEQSSDKYKINKTNNYNLSPYIISPLQQTAEKPTDGDEDSNTQNEAIHNTNERTSGNHNEKSEDLDLRVGDNNTNSDNHNSNNLTETLRNEDKQNSDNLNKAIHNTNEHGIGNPTEKSEDLELRDLGLSYCDEYHNTIRQTDTMQTEDNFNKANHNSNEHDNGNPNEGYIASLEAEMAMQVETMRTEGITQPIVDIDQTPDIPIEPNEDILQQAYEWFNGEGDYDPINLPNEEPIAPKNASEGLKDPRVDNYTQNPLDALKTAENPQKSNPTTETPIAENGNTQIQSDSNYKKADSNENQDKPKAVAEELNTAHEKPQTPKNASEGLTTTALNNYTKTNGDTLRMAEIPQKSNCTVEEEIDAILDAVPNTPKTTEKKPSKKPKGGWYVHPRDRKEYVEILKRKEFVWKYDEGYCRFIEGFPPSSEVIYPIVEASYNRYNIITCVDKINSHLCSQKIMCKAENICTVYWEGVLWYYDETAKFSDGQIWLLYDRLKTLKDNIKQCGFNKEANDMYKDYCNKGYNVNPKLIEPKCERPKEKKKNDDEDFDEE